MLQRAFCSYKQEDVMDTHSVIFINIGEMYTTDPELAMCLMLLSWFTRSWFLLECPLKDNPYHWMLFLYHIGIQHQFDKFHKLDYQHNHDIITVISNINPTTVTIIVITIVTLHIQLDWYHLDHHQNYTTTIVRLQQHPHQLFKAYSMSWSMSNLGYMYMWWI